MLCCSCPGAEDCKEELGEGAITRRVGASNGAREHHLTPVRGEAAASRDGFTAQFCHAFILIDSTTSAGANVSRMPCKPAAPHYYLIL